MLFNKDLIYYVTQPLHPQISLQIYQFMVKSSTEGNPLQKEGIKWDSLEVPLLR